MTAPSNAAWLQAMAAALPDDERLLLSAVPGDPATADATAWNVRPWTWGAATPAATTNNYVCVSSFRRGPDGWRRRAAEFGRGVAFMIDDLGTKVPLDPVLRAAVPSMLCETSPGNFQAWYLLADPVTDYEDFAALQAAFVARWAGGRDPGMGGPNRVGRLPEGINGKRGGAWPVRAVEWAPERRWTRAALLERLDLVLLPRTRPRFTPASSPNITPEDRAARAAEFESLCAALDRADAFQRRAFGRNGRRPLLCPWWRQHSGQARTGAYLSAPAEQNAWWGSFVCFHSNTHNNACHLRDLKRVVFDADDAARAAALDAANAAATAK